LSIITFSFKPPTHLSFIIASEYSDLLLKEEGQETFSLTAATDSAVFIFALSLPASVSFCFPFYNNLVTKLPGRYALSLESVIRRRVISDETTSTCLIRKFLNAVGL
jgi:hypothetical protein